MNKRWLVIVFAGGMAIVGLAVVAVFGAVGFYYWWAPPAAAPPRGANASAAPSSELSVLVVPVSVPITAIERSVDSALPDVIVEQNGKELENGLAKMDLKVTRAGAVSVRADGDALAITAPIDVTARVYPAGLGKAQGVTANASLAWNLRLDPALSEDWRLTPKVRVTHTWLSTPSLTVAGLTFPIERLADRKLEEAETEYAPKIAKKIAEKSDTRERVEAAWSGLHVPVKVAETPPTWWVTDPERLLAGDPYVDGNSVVLLVGVEARFSAVVGSPGPSPRIDALPPRVAPSGTARFSIVTPVRIEWEQASKLANAQIAGKSWTLGGATVQAESVELYPSGDSVVVALHWAAHAGLDADGTLYLSGRPKLDAGGRTLRIVDFAAVVGTWDRNIASPEALAQSGLQDEIAAKLVFPIGDQLDQVRSQAETALQGRRSGVNVRGQVSSVEVRDVRVTDEGLVVDTRVLGSASMESRLLFQSGTPKVGPAPARAHGG